MAPKQDPPQNAPTAAQSDAGELAMPFVPRFQDIPQHSAGVTDRVWSLPFEMKYGAHHPNESSMLHFWPTNTAAIRNTLRFLVHHAPETLEPFMSFMAEREPRTFSWMSQYIDEEKKAGPIMSADITRSPHDAPRSFKLPTLNDKHWAYQAHYELGHGVSAYDDFEKACRSEALSDLGVMTWYIERYNALAKEYTGQALDVATGGAQFRDPYRTCMQICLKDMEMPPHFIALIHYGIGTFMLTWGCHKEMTRPIYERLVAMYTEDFG